MPVDPRLLAAANAPHGAGRDLVSSLKPKRGYAAAPGTGPARETCASCRHITGVKGNEFASACGAAKRGSFGVAIYIASSSPACRRWEARV